MIAYLLKTVLGALARDYARRAARRAERKMSK